MDDSGPDSTDVHFVYGFTERSDQRLPNAIFSRNSMRLVGT
jgi:hypothetical protein